MRLVYIPLFPLIALAAVVPSPAADEAQIGISSSNDFSIIAGLTCKLLPCTFSSLKKLRPPSSSGYNSREKVRGLHGLREVQAQLLAVLFCGM